MLILAGPSGANAHDGGKFHPEQKGRIFSVMDGGVTSISTMTSTTSAHPGRSWTLWHGCTPGNTSKNSTVSAARVGATWILIPTHKWTLSVRLAEHHSYRHTVTSLS